MTNDSASGFTLIELLIVVAVISILAAIAVPNFLEAQARAKVARVRSDMRTLHTAIEIYRVDFGEYPGMIYTSWSMTDDPENPDWAPPRSLSTPIAYVSDAYVPDTFPCETEDAVGPLESRGKHVRYANLLQAKDDPAWPFDESQWEDLCKKNQWVLSSRGPDLVWLWGGGAHVWASNIEETFRPQHWYDSSNGTISNGDIFRAPIHVKNHLY